MKILLYSQQGDMGGSTRLLLNLARYLGDFHDVSLCLAATANREATAARIDPSLKRYA